MAKTPDEPPSGSGNRAVDLDRRTLALNEQTNIWRAAAKGDIAAIDEFLQIGAAVNEVDGNEMRTALFCAVLYNQIETAAYLISRGANTNVRDLYGDTPLMLAAINGSFKIASLLLHSGADVTAQDFSEPPETAAAKADRNVEKDIVELLRGATRNMK